MSASTDAGLPRALYAARYSPQFGRWRTGLFHVMPRPRRLRVATWNILFDGDRWEARLNLLLGELARLHPDLIALQEVTPRQLEQILARDWIRAEFSTSDMDGDSVMPHGVLLLSRPAMLAPRLLPLPSQRDRKLLLADVETAFGTLRIGVAHLESGRNQEAVRVRQLEILGRSLSSGKPALVVGDLNFDADSDPEEARLPNDLRDCWRELHPADAGKTLDPDANALRGVLTRQGRKNDRAMRCDRVLLNPGPEAAWRPLQIRRIGTAPPARGAEAFASDHFGLIATIGRGSRSPASGNGNR